MKTFFLVENERGSHILALTWNMAQSDYFTFDGAEFSLETTVSGEQRKVVLKLLSGHVALFASLKFCIEDWTPTRYLLMPAAVYNGNRVTVIDPLPHYPPQTPPDFMDLNPPLLTGAIQHLNPDGGGTIEQMSGEYAFPGLGYFSGKEKKSCWLLTGQGNEAGDYSYKLSESENGSVLELLISAPLHRKFRQRSTRKIPANDAPVELSAGQILTFEVAEIRQKCGNLAEFFHQASELRNRMVPAGKLPDIYPYSEAVRVIYEKTEAENWRDDYGYYATVSLPFIQRTGFKTHYQLGWVGGGMRTEYMLLDGAENSRKQALREFDFIFRKAQRPSGFFYTTCCDDHFYPDNIPKEGISLKRNILMRKNADALLFLTRQMLHLTKRGEKIPELWLSGIRKCADAFCRLWERYGQFGYHLDADREEIIIGNGGGGAPACAGLAMASELFHEKQYLEIALQSVRCYAKNYLHKGLVYGGVGDALQAPDSESAYGLLEALVTVWEYSQEPELLKEAEFAADYVSTWCVSYDYVFPPDCTFGRIGMTSCGTVYANAQNRHASPGFCSCGGDALFKLYRVTGKKKYAQLLREVVHAIPQYVSRADRPIHGLENNRINERVNLGDWEGRDHIGEVFDCSCWPELSLLFARIQIPGVYVNTDTKEVICFDHVQASLCDEVLTICNQTDFPAEVTLLAENTTTAGQSLKTDAFRHFQKVTILPHGEIRRSLHQKK